MTFQQCLGRESRRHDAQSKKFRFNFSIFLLQSHNLNWSYFDYVKVVPKVPQHFALSRRNYSAMTFLWTLFALQLSPLGRFSFAFLFSQFGVCVVRFKKLQSRNWSMIAPWYRYLVFFKSRLGLHRKDYSSAAHPAQAERNLLGQAFSAETCNLAIFIVRTCWDKVGLKVVALLLLLYFG